MVVAVWSSVCVWWCGNDALVEQSMQKAADMPHLEQRAGLTRGTHMYAAIAARELAWRSREKEDSITGRAVRVVVERAENCDTHNNQQLWSGLEG